MKGYRPNGRANARRRFSRERAIDRPDEFIQLQVRRLSEAMLVAYSAMTAGNLKAVDQVIKVVRELDRYHGFGAYPNPRIFALAEPAAPAPLALPPLALPEPPAALAAPKAESMADGAKSEASVPTSERGLTPLPFSKGHAVNNCLLLFIAAAVSP